MPYPLIQWPTFKEFKATLEKEFDCQFKTKKMLRNGDPYFLCYFERNFNNEIIQCSIDSYNDDERISIEVIRSVCRRLKIDPARFGLTLG